ncbi:MAG: pilus assembly FimT family protein [Coraliomargaritaceae bacterium]
MTSATGNRRSSTQASGFSLVEILLVIGLLALASGMIVSNAIGIAERGNELPADQIIKAAIRSARFEAARKGRITELSYDRENGQLTVQSDSGEPIHFELGENFAENGPGEIEFRLIPPARGMEKYPDPYEDGIETKRIRFAPDCSSQPFSVQIDYGTGSPEILAFDPFSSLVLARQ